MGLYGWVKFPYKGVTAKENPVSKKPYKVRVNIHYQATGRVTLYMNSKKVFTTDDADFARQTGQRLVDEGTARWSPTTFAKSLGN